MPEESIWTSALATAQFLADQMPGGTAYVIGEAGLTTALHEVGYVLTDTDPDFVVLGETRTYSFEAITRAIRLIDAGARFIATNPDPTGPSADGPLPATGAVAALITRATGAVPYVVGKPNPMMFRSAMNRIDAHSETTAMVGRPHGHGRGRRHRGRAGDHARADRLDPAGRGRPLPVPADQDLRLGRRPDPAGLTPGARLSARAAPTAARVTAYSTSPCSSPGMAHRPFLVERAHVPQARLLHHPARRLVDGHRLRVHASCPEVPEGRVHEGS